MPEIQKVTDPAKQVTDPLLLRELDSQGIDKDYVEFFQDYAPRSREKEHSPYAKFYRDLKSGKQFMVISVLPMVNADEVKVEAGWQRQGNTYISKPNQFSAEVSGTKITLTCINDQPDGRKKNDSLTYQPQLYLNNAEQPCGKATLLDTDPVNGNYRQNVLEWDYGICKRRLRLIEGRIHGYWLFTSNPNGEVRIRYNQTGSYKLRLGEYAISDDEEKIPANVFSEVEYPFEVSDSQTFYPDADPETSSVDGRVVHGLVSLTWAQIVAAAGTHSYDSVVKAYSIVIKAASTTDRWYQLTRGIFLFDTSGLPDNANISAATLSIYGSGKKDDLNITPDVKVYSSNPASNTALEPGDFDCLGSTAFCDTPITYANWSTTGYNDFALNSSGIAQISKTGVSKFGLRNANYDVSGTTPAWSDSGLPGSALENYYAEQGTGYKPKLVVTYTAGVTEKTSSDAGSGADAYVSLEKGEGEIKTSSDTGSGVEGTPLPSAFLTGSENGSGIDALIFRLLAAVDVGGGVEASSVEVDGQLKDLFASELGEGSDSLTAKIEMPTKGGGMKLWT